MRTSDVAASLGVSYTGAVKALGILAADGVAARSDGRWQLVDSPRTQALLGVAPALLPPVDSISAILAGRTVSDGARRWLPVMTDRVVRRFHPDRVLLFGSQARGEASADSDVDILVVVPDGSDVRRTTREIYEELEDLPIAKDVLVATSTDVETFGRLVGTVLKPALEEGVSIYERV
jgi:uncharacterized protein